MQSKLETWRTTYVEGGGVDVGAGAGVEDELGDARLSAAHTEVQSRLSSWRHRRDVTALPQQLGHHVRAADERADVQRSQTGLYTRRHTEWVWVSSFLTAHQHRKAI